MSGVIKYVFKILGILVISLIVWALFIGRPSGKATTTAQTYTQQGSVFEELVYGNRTSGFKWASGMTWLQATGCNGIQSELFTKSTWENSALNNVTIKSQPWDMAKITSGTIKP